MLGYMYYCTMRVLLKGQKRALDPWNGSYRWLRATMWVLGNTLGPLEEEPVFLTAELWRCTDMSLFNLD